MGIPSRTVLSVGFATCCLLLAPALGGRSEAGAQARGSAGTGHTCLDCHLRKHEERTAVRESMATSRSAGDAFRGFSLDLPMGHSAINSECLACHSSAERRMMRAGEQPSNPMPIAGAQLLGTDLSDDHPLGDERGGTSWSRGLFGSGVGRGVAPVDARERLIAEPGSMDCSDCHDPHSSFDALDDPSTARAVCLSCHDPAYYVFQGHITPACGDCHTMHGAPGDPLMAARNPDDQCTACHEGLSTFSSARVDPTLRGPPGHDDLQRSRCTDCHRVHAEPGS